MCGSSGRRVREHEQAASRRFGRSTPFRSSHRGLLQHRVGCPGGRLVPSPLSERWAPRVSVRSASGRPKPRRRRLERPPRQAAWQGVNSGCGPRYTEVEWGQLVAEFRLGTFSGYRYMKGGWPLTTPGSPRRPRLQSRRTCLGYRQGDLLGNTLGQVRLAYGKLHFVGVDKWRAANGIIFVVDALRDPEPPSSKVVEIKLGTWATSETCGARHRQPRSRTDYSGRSKLLLNEHILPSYVRFKESCSSVREKYMATVLVSLQGQFSLHQSRHHIRTVHTKVGVRSPLIRKCQSR